MHSATFDPCWVSVGEGFNRPSENLDAVPATKRPYKADDHSVRRDPEPGAERQAVAFVEAGRVETYWIDTVGMSDDSIGWHTSPHQLVPKNSGNRDNDMRIPEAHVLGER